MASAMLAALITGAIAYGIDARAEQGRAKDRQETALRDARTLNLLTTIKDGQVGIERDVAELAVQGRSTSERIRGIDAAIREFHSDKQKRYNDLTVLNASVSGIVTMTPPYKIKGEWRAIVALFDQKQVISWEPRLSDPDDPKLRKVLELASPIVDAVPLSVVKDQAELAVHINPATSFLVRGNVDACRRKLIETFGTSYETDPLPGPPAKTGRDYVAYRMKFVEGR